MLYFLRRLGKILPTFILAFLLALAVWISAVTSADPNVDNVFPRPIPIDVIGQDPGLVLTSDLPRQVTISLKAPRSIWDRMTADDSSIKATVDLSGLKAGTHTVKVQVNVAQRPVQVLNVAPTYLTITFETLATRTMAVQLVTTGDPAVGYQVGDPTLSQDTVSVSGPEPLVKRVNTIQLSVDLNQVHEAIRQTLSLRPLDADGLLVDGLTLTPDKITVSLPVTQRGGYRNVVVKVLVTGQVSNGFRVTNISVYPPAITVYSNDPTLVDQLPGYVETSSVDLNGARDDLDVLASLKLPDGVSVVGKQTVDVQVGVAAIEGSITLNNMRVQMVGISPNMVGQVSPDRVDVILSGPLYLLDQLNISQVHVTLDLTNLEAGTYQLVPRVEIDLQNLRVESILPSTIEVVITAVTPTPTITITPTPTTTPTPTITPTPTPTRRP